MKNIWSILSKINRRRKLYGKPSKRRTGSEEKLGREKPGTKKQKEFYGKSFMKRS
jgi:hypothetical protein